MNMCANNNLILFFSVVLFLSFFVHKLDFISSEMSSGNHAVNVFSPQICANARLSTNVRTFWPRVCKVLCGGPNTAIWRHWVDATASLRAWTDQKLVEVSPAESALRHPRGWDDEVTGRAGFTVPARCGTYFTERKSLEGDRSSAFQHFSRASSTRIWWFPTLLLIEATREGKPDPQNSPTWKTENKPLILIAWTPVNWFFWFK